ncbi:MAG: photosynthesis system II assembly factor Ycf48 [Anaerolineae bacterium]|nr:photosynthesis system II assembly factor Ycf48 [Gloeobacterales cyanobacterium ES-bin-313]
MKTLWRALSRGAGLICLLLLAGCGPPTIEKSQWTAFETKLSRVDLTDVNFGSEADGWIVGSRSTLLHTLDGGNTWKQEVLKLESKFRFVSASFSGQEGWVVGEPSILLHTTDDGKSWFRIPLDRRLPGNPLKIYALGPQTAEIILDAGIVIKTVDGGKNFKVLTPGSAGGIRSAFRQSDGSYWVVSARGGSYLHWTPGDPQFTNFQRTSPRRLQTMGFGGDKGWMINQGGEMQFSSDSGKTWTPYLFPTRNGIGLIDAGFDSKGKLWSVGGNGTLLATEDLGKTWKANPDVGQKSTLLRVAFFGEKGFAIGQNGSLLRYTPQ